MARGDFNRKPLHERAWNSRVAAEYGCTVTFENDGGQTLVLTRKGPPQDALRALCADALAADPTFRVICYSNPATIRQDLIGRFDPTTSARHRDSLVRAEARALGGAGMLHMLHPRLRGSSSAPTTKYRAIDARQDR
jgi:hypothetical protein